ncbi:E3 ubiquitin-protein ligase PUB24 [Camellia lanceoleosa]|uniref:E3 ubiquitin-protein ligase PUB24 n=1 Tax=Camellia lanceoleosa TaxID=1840588 RepID=A0ACC0FW53_9ERIC|nr:E3 ubiquitin-protein ligase PUB24 [Camellia lanceoleosa]
MEDIEVPQYFICPISLQIMKDPVTAITGITYDRESIEQWLFKHAATTSTSTATCPVTNLPLPRDSDLTPNHTLRRLIQAWCTQNASKGIDRIPTPKPSLDKTHVLNLIRDLWLPELQLKTLRKLEVIAIGHERNRRYMVEAGVVKAMASFIVTCYKRGETTGIEEALSILFHIQSPSSTESKLVVLIENDQIIEALTWVLGQKIHNYVTVKSNALQVLKTIIGKASSNILERLKRRFFKTIVSVLRGSCYQCSPKCHAKHVSMGDKPDHDGGSRGGFRAHRAGIRVTGEEDDGADFGDIIPPVFLCGREGSVAESRCRHCRDHGDTIEGVAGGR